MRCCGRKLVNPDVINGTAYFVCPECGDIKEVENYQLYTVEKAYNYFEEKYGFILPKEYEEFSSYEDKKIVKIPHCNNDSLEFYFGEGFYEIGSFASVDPNAEDNIYDNIIDGREWGLSNELIPFEGDGHTWIALDYRDSCKEPKVVVVETDEGNSLVVANTFKEFLSKLLSFEEVYDCEGNIIYNEVNT